MRAVITLLLLMLSAFSPASAMPLIADLSTYSIQLDTGFTGTRVLLFGARAEGGDVVVVVRGPSKNFTVRRKARVAGIWINRDTVKFYDTPDFYAISASRPLDKIRGNDMFAPLGIGMDELIETTPKNTKGNANADAFAQSFLEHQQIRGLYQPRTNLQFMGETLFKTTIDFPDTIPEGDYTAEIYLISNGALTGMQSVPLSVKKTGFDAYVYNLAHGSPVFYGLLSIAIAVASGWVASRVFEKI